MMCVMDTRPALLAAVFALSTPALAQSPAARSASVDVTLTTEAGPITVRLDALHAPLSTANFLRYVDQRRLDNIGFYRVMRLPRSARDQDRLILQMVAIAFYRPAFTNPAEPRAGRRPHAGTQGLSGRASHWQARRSLDRTYPAAGRRPVRSLDDDLARSREGTRWAT